MDVLTVAEPNPQDTLPTQEDVRTVGSDNKFQKAVASWRGIDFTSLVSQLDATASEVVSNSKDAVIERKEVAQKTKDFRKLDDAGKLAEFKSLLKAYQTFVDLLTTHNKTSSAAFLQLYTSLSEAPDPFPLLEASVEALLTSEEIVPRLTSENEELQKRISKLTAELDDTEQRLQSETKARKEAESGSGARIQDIESSWTKALEEKESNWAAKESALEAKVENQERLLKELKANYEVAQRLGHGGEDEAASMSKAAAAELELVTSDLERTVTRLAEMEARNEQLRVDLARASSKAATSNEDDEAVMRLRNENSALLRKMETIRFEKDTEKREWEGKIKQAERHRTSASTEVQQLKIKLQKCADYEEIKRELNMLRSIELSAEDEGENEEVKTNGTSTDDKKETSLEQLLLARNKKLSNDLTLLRVSRQELEQQLGRLREELSQSTDELEKSQRLATTLENDLLRVQEEAANTLPSSGLSVAGTYTSRYPGSSRRGRGSPTSSIISGFDSQRSLGTTSLEALRSGEAVGGGSGILPMVQAQRDRFKQKNQKLEEELSKTYATVTSLRQEVASLQKDNLNLYEKSRYVSTYNRGGNTSSSSAFSQAPTHTSVYSGQDDTSERWKSQYEANISPFAAFRGRENSRAYKRMSVPERMVFSMTRIVMATRTSRNLFAGYCLALHLLVFIMLYWMSASTAAVAGMPLSASAAAPPSLKQSGEKQDWHQEDFG